MDLKRGVPFWLDRDPFVSFDKVTEDLSFDVVVVGAGIVGLHTAYLLRHAGLRVAVLEARRIGQQATGRSTAKVTSQHGLKYTSLIQNFGRDGAKLYADVNENAVKKIAKLSSAMKEEPSLEGKSAFVYAEDEQQADQLRKEADAAASVGLPAEFVSDAGLPFKTVGALRFSRQYQFNPYLYLCKLASLASENGVAVFENSRVIDIEPATTNRLTVNDCVITANTVVVATQMPIVNEGLFFAKAFPFAHPITAALLPDEIKIDGMYISAGTPSHSFRTARREERTYLVSAGGEFKTGDDSSADDVIAEMLDFLERTFGIRELSHMWINEDFRSMDGAAFVGPVTSSQPNLLVATGFEAWGITQGAVAGEILASQIQGRRHPAADLFDATRIKPVAGGPTFVSENLKTATHLVGERVLRSRTTSLEEIAPDEGGIIMYEGEQLAVRKSQDGSTVTSHSAVCTHLGCVVGWNSVDRTWDCSCHGSRFDEDGQVLSGPATKPLEPRSAPIDKQE